MKEQCLCLRTARKMMRLPCLSHPTPHTGKATCVQEHERYYMNVIIPPHPTPAVTDDERAVPVAVPVCVQEHERYCPTHPTHRQAPTSPVAVRKTNHLWQ